MMHKAPLELRDSEYIVHQTWEHFEFIGFETRNKYQVLNKESQQVAFIAEQGKGILGSIARQFPGHWRTFELHIFSTQREKLASAYHPFRFYFNELELYDNDQRLLGRIKKRFSLLSKRFDVEDAHGQVIFEVSSPIWRIWTFPFMRRGKEMARVSKKWTGFLAEAFTDKDNFQVSLPSLELTEVDRLLVLVASVYIDLIYFEHKANE